MPRTNLKHPGSTPHIPKSMTRSDADDSRDPNTSSSPDSSNGQWLEGAAPGLLVASPGLDDPNFEQSVVLMVEHTPEGAVGIVLNKLSETTLQELCEDQEIETERTGYVRVGGPVSPERVWVIHHPEDTGTDAFALTDDISISVTREALLTLLHGAGHEFVVCAGYAGWEAGQLEAEINSGAWLLAPLDNDVVFGAAAGEMWSRTLLRLGIFPTSRQSRIIN